MRATGGVLAKTDVPLYGTLENEQERKRSGWGGGGELGNLERTFFLNNP